MAYRPIGLCGMGKERTKGKGLEGGHTLQAKEMTHLVAPFRARYYCPDGPQATQTSGLCTLGFVQFKAAGLVQAFDLLGAINNFTACPNAENRKNDNLHNSNKWHTQCRASPWRGRTYHPFPTRRLKNDNFHN